MDVRAHDIIPEMLSFRYIACKLRNLKTLNNVYSIALSSGFSKKRIARSISSAITRTNEKCNILSREEDEEDVSIYDICNYFTTSGN